MTDGPLLGLATTEELFREIIARFTITQTGPIMTQNALILAEMLGGLHALDREYRTAEPQEQEPDPIEHMHIWADIPPLTSQLCSCGATRRNEL
jgi:hypothetical protein